MATSSHPLTSLPTRWTHLKTTSSLSQRLVMLLLKVLFLVFSMYLIPTLLHRAVQSLSAVYELLGRRAYTASTPWTSVAVAAVLLVGWHVWLGRLSYKSVRVGDGGWSRVFGRVVVPGVLVLSGGRFVGEVWRRLGATAREV